MSPEFKLPIVGEMLARYPLPIPDVAFLRAYARPGETLELALLSVPPEWIDQPITLTVTETGYTLLQVDINGRNWDCALDTRYFTDGAKTLAVLDRFMRNGWSNADGLTETTEDS